MDIVKEQLTQFAKVPNFVEKMNLAFGESWDNQAANVLTQDWLNGDFSLIPPVKFVSSAEIDGANGAFAAATDTIYLSRELLAGNSANPAVVADVLLEEIGHSVDSRLNVADSPGDEGAIFGAVVQGKELSEGELQGLRGEDDRGTVVLGGENTTIEMSQQQWTIRSYSDWRNRTVDWNKPDKTSDQNGNRQDGKDGIYIDWRIGSPFDPPNNLEGGNNPDYFATFGYTKASFEAGGTYKFRVSADDGIAIGVQQVGQSSNQTIITPRSQDGKAQWEIRPWGKEYSWSPTQTGEYYVIFKHCEVTGNAGVDISWEAQSPTINTSGLADPDGTLDKAKSLVLQGSSLNNGQNGGIIESENIGRNYDYGKDSADYYKFSLNETRRINIGLDNLTADANIELFREGNSNRIAISDKSNTSVETISSELAPGTYYVKVIPYQTAQTDYKLRVTELSGNIEEKGLWRSYDEEDKFYKNGVNLYRFNKNGREDSLGIESDKDTIIVIHGWTDSTETDSDGEESPIKSLGKASAEKYPNYQVLALDWRDPARNSTSSDRRDKGRDSGFPYHGARSITPVATWAVNTLINLGINPNKLSIFGHSLGSHLGTEIGRIFYEDKKLGQLKNFVALDPAHDINDYDLDGNTPGDRKVKEKWDDFAPTSLALVGKEGALGIEGIAGSSEGAARAKNSLVVDLSDGDFIPTGAYHIAPVKIFQKALEKNYLELEKNLALPNDLRPNSYDDNAVVARFGNNGRHEGKIVAKSDGTIELLQYVNGFGMFATLPPK